MPDDFEVLITAEEAWPAFERAVLNAKSEIVAGFRIFDLRTKLRSPEARAIGDDWFDLLAHVVGKGVSFTLTVSDFDPVVGTELHQLSWTTVRQGHALTEMLGSEAGRVTITADMHPAKAGFVPWLAFLPKVIQRRNSAWLELSRDERDREAVLLKKSDMPTMHTVTHHQKLAVIDNEILYIGGLDLNERRWDTKDHAREAPDTWSDVQVIMRGPEAAQARDHLLTFVDACAGRKEPSHGPDIKRTLSTPRRLQFPYLSPMSRLTEIEEAHLKAFREARHLIYIETQFFRSSPITEHMAEAAAKSSDLTAIVVLPALPEHLAFEGKDDLDVGFGMARQKEAIETVTQAFGDRITLATPVRPVFSTKDTVRSLCGSPIIHVHNKVLVKDDDYALIGSANLNGRSLRWDTEVAIDTTNPARVAHARDRLLHHWWFDPLPKDGFAPSTAQAWWHTEIARNGVKRPENRSGFLVPHAPENRVDVAQDLPGVTENMV